MKAFCYGTLKKGFRNHHFLNGADFIGEDTVQGVRLFYSGRGQGFPVAEITGNPEDITKVEIYEINHDIQQNMDWLEGYSAKAPERSLYTRQPIETQSGIIGDIYIGGQCWTHSEDNEVRKIGGVYDWG